MTAGVMTLHLDGKEVGHVPYSGTVDMTTSCIYDTYQEAFDKRRDSPWYECTCGNEPTKVKAEGQYGHWTMWVCLPCKAVVFCPVTAESALGFYEYGGSDEQIKQCKEQIAKYGVLNDEQFGISHEDCTDDNDLLPTL